MAMTNELGVITVITDDVNQNPWPDQGKSRNFSLYD